MHDGTGVVHTPPPMPRFSLCCPVCQTKVPVDPGIPLSSHHCLRCGSAFTAPARVRPERRSGEDFDIDPSVLLAPPPASETGLRMPVSAPRRGAGTLRSAAFPVRRTWSTVQNPPPPDHRRRLPWVPSLAFVGGTIVLSAIFTWRSGAQISHANEAGQRLATERVAEDGLRQRVQAVARRFVTAGSTAEARPLLRPSATLERSISEWARQGGRFPVGWTIHSVARAENSSVLHLWSAGATDATGHRRYLDIVETPAGPKVDFEAFAGSGDMSWQEFVTSRPSTPTLLRVRMLQDDFYNRTFIDRTRWACLRIHQPGRETPVFAYLDRTASGNSAALGRVAPVPRGSEVKGANRDELAETYASWWTVRGCFTDPKASDQFEITDLLSETWTMP